MKAQQNSMAAPMSPVSAGSLVVLVGALCLIGMLAFEASAMSLAEQMDQAAATATASGKPAVSLAVIENPERAARVLESLLKSIIYSSNFEELQTVQSVAQKRGLDLGISRGFSGSQAGKHLMGLSAASFANGPGRR